MIKIEKPNDNTVKVTIKSEDGICPFCDGTGWQKISQYNIGARMGTTPIKIPVEFSIICEWCEGTGKRA